MPFVIYQEGDQYYYLGENSENYRPLAIQIDSTINISNISSEVVVEGNGYFVFNSQLYLIDLKSAVVRKLLDTISGANITPMAKDLVFQYYWKDQSYESVLSIFNDDFTLKANSTVEAAFLSRKKRLGDKLYLYILKLDDGTYSTQYWRFQNKTLAPLNTSDLHFVSAFGDQVILSNMEDETIQTQYVLRDFDSSNSTPLNSQFYYKFCGYENMSGDSASCYAQNSTLIAAKSKFTDNDNEGFLFLLNKDQLAQKSNRPIITLPTSESNEDYNTWSETTVESGHLVNVYKDLSLWFSE